MLELLGTRRVTNGMLDPLSVRTGVGGLLELLGMCAELLELLGMCIELVVVHAELLELLGMRMELLGVRVE